MAINFPSSPVNNQTHSENGINYVYDSAIGAWNVIAETIPEVGGTLNTQIIFNNQSHSNGSNGLTYSLSSNTFYANTVNVTGYIYGNGAFLTGVVSDFSPAYNTANAAFDKANSANVLAYDTGIGANAYTNAVSIAANTWANTKLSNTSGVVFGGDLTISNDLTIGNNLYSINSAFFDTTTTVAGVDKGQIVWNSTEETFDLGMANGAILQVGQEIYYRVKNQSGSTITEGTVVMAAGTLGASGRILITPAIADGTYPSKYVMGIATTTMATGDDGYVTAFGKVRGLDTSMWSEGDILYANSSVAGALQNTMPSAPNTKTTVAIVVSKHDQTGTLFVRPTYGSKLNEDEMVELNGLTNGDVIQYVSANGRFENKQSLVNAYGVANAGFDKANSANVLAYNTGIGANAYTNTSTTAANNYAGVMANSANGYTNTVVAANLVTSRAYTNTSTTAANNYAGVMANSSNAWSNTKLSNTNVTLAGNIAVQGNVTVNSGFAYNFGANAYMYYNSACNSIDFVIN